MIALGSKVKDKVTGFEGIAIGRSTFLNGCARVGVQPKIGADGKIIDASWFDEPQLETVEANVVPQGAQDTGGPIPSVPTRNVPG